MDSDLRTDAALVAAHLDGDRVALGAIYDRYADSLFDTAAAMLRDHADAADAVHDVILIAAERVGQLRDPQRLRPWLFAILRNQVYTRTARRSRTRPTDMQALERSEVGTDRSIVDDHGDDLDAEALATLVRDAAAGLDERDQLVLEYSVRQELAGDDLAAALGVSLDQSYVLVHRMRERVERALGALTVARMGRKDCDDLRDVLRDWDGTFSVLVRKRVARHVERCEVCSDTKSRYAVLSLVGAAPVLAAPPDLRDRVLATVAGHTTPTSTVAGQRFDAAGGFPSVRRSSRKLAVIAAVAAVVAMLLIAGTGISIAARRTADDTTPTATSSTNDLSPSTTARSSTTTVGTVVASPIVSPPTTLERPPNPTTEPTSVATPPTPTSAPGSAVITSPAVTVPSAAIATTTPTTVATTPMPVTTTVAPPSAGRLTLSHQTLDFGLTHTALGLTLTNVGGQPAQFDVTGAGPGFTTSATTGSLPAGRSVTITVTFDREVLDEGHVSRTLTVSSNAAGGGTVDVTGIVDRAPVVRIVQPPDEPVCPDIATPTVVADVGDSTLASVHLSWSGPGSAGSTVMSRSGSQWSAPLTIPSVEGNWSYVVTATDAAGHVTTRSGTFVLDCPTPG